MKKFLMALLLAGSALVYNSGQAQVSLNVNIGRQPDWGPVGYDYVNYYYLPDLDVYYSVPRRQFVYLDGNRWVFANSLPPRYGRYDLYGGYKVVVNDNDPWMRAEDYRRRYGRYRNWNGERQVILRDHHDNRYKNNGPGRGDNDDQGNGKNRGKGKGKGKGHDRDDR